MKTRVITALVLMFGISGLALSQTAYPDRFSRYARAGQAAEMVPAILLKEGLKKLMAFVGADPRPNRMQAVAFLEREVVPYFDFSYMARWAAGAGMWQRMGEARQNELESYIKRDFLATLATRLTGFGEQKVQVTRARRAGKNEVVVGAMILNPGAYPAKLSFRFYRSPEGWKVFDVSANGSSAVMHYRKQFRNMMRQRQGQQRGYRR